MWFPTLLVSLGIGIHALALFGIEASKVPTWLHILMLVADTVVLTGLLSRTTLGYWLAVGLFVQQSVCQSYWAIQATAHGWDLWHLQAMAALLCTIALIILILGKPALLKILGRN